MADLVESTVFPAGVYQLELSDIVQGGPGGIDNRAPQQLANRTRWLNAFKLQLDGSQSMTGTLRIGDATSNIGAVVSGLGAGIGGGSSFLSRAGGITRIAIGNVSSVLGGPYDANGIVLSAGDLVFGVGSVPVGRWSAAGLGIGTQLPAYRVDAQQSNPAAGVIANFHNTATTAQNGALVQLHQSNVSVWRYGLVPGQDAFAFYGFGGGTYPEFARFDGFGNLGLDVVPTFKLDMRVNSINGNGLRIVNAQNGASTTLFSNGTQGSSQPGWAGSTVLEAIAAAGGSLILSSPQSGVLIQTGPQRTTRLSVSPAGGVAISRPPSDHALTVDGAIVLGSTGPGYGGIDAIGNPAERFTVAGNVVPRYGLTWKLLADALNAPSCVLSGWGGVRLFTNDVERLRCDAAGVVLPQTNIRLDDLATRSFGTNGWQKLPGNTVGFGGTPGLLFQWGTTGAFGTDSVNNAVSFPISFPNACLGVWASASSNNGISTASVASYGHAHGWSPSSFFINNDSLPSQFTWFAIGF